MKNIKNKNLSYKSAYDLMLKNCCQLNLEKVSLEKVLGRILADDIFADTDSPYFNKSAMDGYALAQADIALALKVVEIIPAGVVPEKILKNGECSKIMTGAMLPQGADCVVPVELTRTEADLVYIVESGKKKNICYQGEDFKKGEKLLNAGTLVRAQEIAVLASAGVVNPLVSRKVKVGLISTGDELVEPQAELKENSAKIRNSNAYQLYAQAVSAGAEVNYYGIINDQEQKLVKVFQQAAGENDILIVSGGVSAGDYDFVPSSLVKAGFEIIFYKVKIQPGKPLVFASKQKCFCFGLPGNPVSTFMMFEIFIRDFISLMQGRKIEQRLIKLQLAEKFERKNAERQVFLPIYYNENGEVFFVPYHGSGHFHALSKANGILSIPVGKVSLAKGDKIDIRQI